MRSVMSRLRQVVLLACFGLMAFFGFVVFALIAAEPVRGRTPSQVRSDETSERRWLGAGTVALIVGVAGATVILREDAKSRHK